LIRSNVDTGAGGGATIVDGVGELDGAARTIGGDMEGGCVGDSNHGPAGHSRDACWAYRHSDTGYLEGGRCTRTSRFDLRRIDGIWTAYEHFRNSWIGMVRRQCAGTGKGVSLRGLSRVDGDTRIGLGASIIQGVGELDRAAGGICRNRKVAVSVKLTELPQTVPAMLFGFTTKSTLVTMNGSEVGDGVGGEVAVGVGLEPVPPLVPHAARLKIARQMKTMLRSGCFKIFIRIDCFNMNFLLRGALNMV